MQYLVDLDNLRHYSYIESDVNDEKLLVTLRRVQDIDIEPILGTPLFKKLLADIEADTLTGNYQTLVDTYILPVIYAGCDIKAVTHQNFKIRNKYTGIAEGNNERANTVEENNSLIDQLRKDFSFYKNRLIGYLKDNEDNFPEYCEVGGDKFEEIPPENEKGNNYKDRISFI